MHSFCYSGGLSVVHLAFFFTFVFFVHVRCSAQKESTKKVNMKRENKAYSYKEQIIELELQEVKCSYYHFMYFWCCGFLEHMLSFFF